MNLQTSSDTPAGTATEPQSSGFSEHGRGEGVLGEVWSHRELLFFFAWRDIKVRYKQTALGVVWAIIQPLLTMAIFTVIFGRFAHIPTPGVPKPIFYFSGLLPWLFLANTVPMASMSMVTNMQLLTKIYFPRVMLPISITIGGIVDFLIGSVLMVGFFFYYHIHPTLALLIWPVLVLQMFLLSMAISLFLSTLNVKFRDVKYAIPFAIQIWMFTTPVIYPPSILPAALRKWIALNPAAGLVDSFRHCLVPQSPVRWSMEAISAAVTVILFIGALAYFRKNERAFADVI